MISEQNVLKVKTQSEVRNDIIVYFDPLNLVYFLCSLLRTKHNRRSLQSAQIIPLLRCSDSNCTLQELQEVGLNHVQCWKSENIRGIPKQTGKIPTYLGSA